MAGLSAFQSSKAVVECLIEHFEKCKYLFPAYEK
jgi:hypothetical protein